MEAGRALESMTPDAEEARGKSPAPLPSCPPRWSAVSALLGDDGEHLLRQDDVTFGVAGGAHLVVGVAGLLGAFLVEHGGRVVADELVLVGEGEPRVDHLLARVAEHLA